MPVCPRVNRTWFRGHFRLAAYGRLLPVVTGTNRPEAAGRMIEASPKADVLISDQVGIYKSVGELHWVGSQSLLLHVFGIGIPRGVDMAGKLIWKIHLLGDYFKPRSLGGIGLA